MIDAESERKFLEAVANGASIFCAQNLYDAIKQHDAINQTSYASRVGPCKYLSPGTMVAVDIEGAMKAVFDMPVTTEFHDDFKIPFFKGDGWSV